ncbi:MAG: hypothetical protein IKS21_06930 [Oscillospiraceae bacterium]|nr:hypothetical protein [Oscillospiraceae bacterium]
MVKLIAGRSGTGKTQRMVSEINEAVQKELGSLVCIEQRNSLRYDINYKVRLIEYQTYQLAGQDALKAFISGLHAGNFDISHIYLKSVHRLLNTDDPAELEKFCNWCRDFGDKHGMNFTMTFRMEAETAPEGLRAYME